MTDHVFIEELQIDTLIGIYDWERRIRQPLVFDIEMAFDNRVPAATDDITLTLNYKDVSKRLIDYVGQSSFGLVETLAEHCAQIILDEFEVSNIRLKLSKPGAVRGARAVGVVIERSRAVESRQPALETKVIASRAPDAKIAEESIRTSPMQAPKKKPVPELPPATRLAYLSLGSNIEPEDNLRKAVTALRERFGEVVLSPVYSTPAFGFEGPNFLNAIAILASDIHPFALHDWLHALELKQGRDRRDSPFSDRTLDVDIIYFGDLVLEGPGDLQLPRPELNHAFVLKPLADVAPDFVDPVRHTTLAQLWKAHPQYAAPPQMVDICLTPDEE